MKTPTKIALLKIIDVCETFQNSDIEGHTEESIIADAERAVKLIIRIASDGLQTCPTLAFTGADADSALALLTEPEKAFVEIAKAIGAESVSLTQTGKCKACGEPVSPSDEFCMACRCENNWKQ